MDLPVIRQVERYRQAHEDLGVLLMGGRYMTLTVAKRSGSLCRVEA